MRVPPHPALLHIATPIHLPTSLSSHPVTLHFPNNHPHPPPRPTVQGSLLNLYLNPDPTTPPDALCHAAISPLPRSNSSCHAQTRSHRAADGRGGAPLSSKRSVSGLDVRNRDCQFDPLISADRCMYQQIYIMFFISYYPIYIAY